MFETTITPESLFDELMDGVLLCKLAGKVVAGEVQWRGLVTPTTSPEKVRPGETQVRPGETQPEQSEKRAKLPKAPRGMNPRGNSHSFIVASVCWIIHTVSKLT